MKNFKVVAVLMFLAAALCMPTPSQAQITPQVMAVGSSGTFTTTVIAMASPDSVVYPSRAAVCGQKVWTYSNAQKAYAQDPRSGTQNEPGNIAVVWDDDTNPTAVCVYFSVDSIVGDRLLLAQSGSGGTSGNGTMFLDSSVQSAPGQNKIAYLQDTATSGLPSKIYQSVNGQHFNVAFTDIRPDDAEFAVNKANCTPADQLRCLGFGPSAVGSAVLSTWNTNNQANTTAFSVSGGTDPINTSLTVPATTTVNIGAYPVMLIYNTSDTGSASSLGTLLPTNVLSHVINMFWTGRSQGSQDLTGQLIPGVIVDVVQREPVSGTYNTFEFQGVEDRDADINLTQETGFGPNTSNPNGMPGQPACSLVIPGSATYVSPTRNTFCANPMNVPGPGNGGLGYNRKYRAIGTGELVSSIDSTNGANRIGYAFFGLGTFGGKTHTRYMKVDGVDPILPNYDTNGDMSALCSGKVNLNTFTCTHNPSFDGIVAGNYRIWNIIRAVYYSSTPQNTTPSIAGLILASQDQSHAATGPHDFVPSIYCTASSTAGTCNTTVQNLKVFRVHYPLSGITVGTSSNGNSGEPPENGGDMAGAILPSETDTSFFNITGSDVTGYIQ